MAPNNTTGVIKTTILNTQTGETFAVCYNPEQYQIEQGNVLAEVGVPGLPAPPLQFVRGKGRTLSMELMCDSYEQHIDVRTLTDPIVGLLDIDPTLGAPPVLVVTLAGLHFECVLAECNQRYTMFDRDGTPVRAILSARFREFIRLDFETQAGFFTGISSVDSLQNNETLQSLAQRTLGDPQRWREIATANGITDPLSPPAGQPLIIPRGASS